MSGFEVLLIIAAGAIALYALNYLTGKASSAASRQVLKGVHQRGRSQMERQLRFSAPIDPTTLCELIIKRVNAHSSAPVVAPGLYVSEHSGNNVVFAWGSLMSTAMRAKVVTRPARSGSTGSFDVLQWKESGANVLGSGAVGPLIDRIKSAVDDAGGTSSEL